MSKTDTGREAEAAYWRQRTPDDVRDDYASDEWVWIAPRTEEDQNDHHTSKPPETDGRGGH